MPTSDSPSPLEAAMFAAIDAVYRDFGDYGRHSKRCVYWKSADGRMEWCCADECKLAAT